MFRRRHSEIIVDDLAPLVAGNSKSKARETEPLVGSSLARDCSTAVAAARVSSAPVIVS